MEITTAWPVQEVQTKPLYYIAKPLIRPKKAYLAVKRISDICVSLLGLFVLLLPMCVIAAVIVIDSPGGPIFRQERLGKDGRPFMMYKFRSMRQDAEVDGPQWAEQNDSRCTGFGCFLRMTRLDELPQLYNILRGDMSFVGPRPERACFYEEFETYIHGFRHRLMVKPGLTGWAQINGGYDLKPEEKIVYDMEYIEKQSVKMDMTCIFKTIRVVLNGNGAR